MPKQVAQKAFILKGLPVFTQRVCNRLKRSQLKDPWSRAQSRLEGNYKHNACTPHTDRIDTAERERGVDCQIFVTVVRGGMFISTCKQPFESVKIWLTHQPTVILAMTCDECPAGRQNRQNCQDPYLSSPSQPFSASAQEKVKKKISSDRKRCNLTCASTALHSTGNTRGLIAYFENKNSFTFLC